MTTLSKIAIASLTMIGVASAQGKAPDPKAPAKAPDAKPAKPAPMEMPKPPPELAEAGKAASGTWKCKGEDSDHTGTKSAMTGTLKIKLDLDGWWLVETFDGKGRGPFKMAAYTTYDVPSKKWRKFYALSGGTQMNGSSDGIKDNKLVWNLDVVSPQGAGTFRDTVDLADPKAGVKYKGEMSMDKGKSWLPVYEMTCKK